MSTRSSRRWRSLFRRNCWINRNRKWNWLDSRRKRIVSMRTKRRRPHRHLFRMPNVPNMWATDTTGFWCESGFNLEIGYNSRCKKYIPTEDCGSSRTWYFVVGWVVPDVSNDYFIFTLKQLKNYFYSATCPEYEGATTIQNVGNHSFNDETLHPRKPEASSTPLWEP